MNRDYYDNVFDEDSRAYGTRADQIEFMYTKKLLDRYVKPDSSVIELGCGTGYYGLYLSDRCKFYQGIDYMDKHVAIFRQKIKEKNLMNLAVSQGDARNLTGINRQSYDVVLVFGPMYHLPPQDRLRAIKESRRICKKGGIILFAYINKAGAYVRVCLDDQLNEKYPNKETNAHVLQLGEDDAMPDLFYYTMPEEIEKVMEENGLKVIRNAGVNFVLSNSVVNQMSEEKYGAWTEIMDFMFESPSCTGLSNHAVIVCENK